MAFQISRKGLPNLVPILIILTVVTLSLFQVSFFRHTLKWDMMDQFFPCRYFISECFHHGVFPLWCPYINFGYPYYADPQGGLFYPGTWLLAATTGYHVYTMNIEYVAHVAIAGIAFFYLLKGFALDNYTAVVFGILYSLSGIFIGNAQHLSWIIAMAWMPLIILSLEDIFQIPTVKNALKLSLFTYLGLTGGYPGLVLIAGYFLLLYAAVRICIILIRDKNYVTGRRIIFMLVLSGMVFVLLSGGYLYSFVQSVPYITRSKPITIAEANNLPLSPKAMISFLFPFATVTQHLQLGTDISMANAFAGFLLLPFIFIAFLKGSTTGFQKVLLVFAIICLAAALGKYFFVRSIFFKVLPGLNMIRHASIFRTFMVLGLLAFAASGFEWLLHSISKEENRGFIKRLFIGYFVFLLLVAIYVFFKADDKFPVRLLSLRDSPIRLFNSQFNVYSHILSQCSLQLVLLLIIILSLYVGALSAKTHKLLLCCVVMADIIIAAQWNLPGTATSEVRPSDLQARLAQMPEGFPVPPLVPVEQFTHVSDGSTLPIWYNISFFKKIPAKDGFNSFYLSSVDDFYGSGESSGILKRPVVFFNNSATKFSLDKFYPNEVIVSYRADTTNQFTVLQTLYPGWKVFIDGQPNMIEKSYHNFMSVQAPAGKHTIRFVFEPPVVMYLFFLTAGLFLIITLYLAVGMKATRVLNS